MARHFADDAKTDSYLKTGPVAVSKFELGEDEVSHDHRRMDKLTAMRTFVTVGKTGSFSVAAQMLSVPKTHWSQRIQELEAVLLVRLLHRTTRVVSLTEEGRTYLPKCEQILDDVDQAEQAVGSVRDEPSGRLSLSCTGIVARSLILPRLDEFLAPCPKVSVSVSITNRIVNLQEAGLDCAIRGGLLENSSLISRHLADIGFGIYAATAFMGKRCAALTFTVIAALMGTVTMGGTRMTTEALLWQN